MDLDIVTVICRELETRAKELVRCEVDTVAVGEEALFDNVEVASAIVVDTDKVGELNASASSKHVVSYMINEVAVALSRAEDGEMLTWDEAGEELLIKIPLPGVLELAKAGEKTLLSGTLKDEAELEVSVGRVAEPDGDEMTKTDEAFDRIPVMIGSEAYEDKVVLIEDETAVVIKLVDGPLGEIGDASVKDVLFQKFWYGFPWLTGIGGWVVAEDTAVPLLTSVATDRAEAIGDENAAVPRLEEAVPDDKTTGTIDGLLRPVERGGLGDSTTLLEGDVDSLEDTTEMLIVVGKERTSDGDDADSTSLFEFALEVRRVEVSAKISVDLAIIVVLLDEEVRTEVDAGEEPVAITARTLVLEVPLFVGDDDIAGASESEEFSPW
jgi:hypothetical protein